MTVSNPLSLACYVAQLESSANALGLSLQPEVPTEKNLPERLYNFFVQLKQNCETILTERNWETLSESDQISYQTIIRAIKGKIEKLLRVGAERKSSNGTTKVINLMLLIKNLVTLSNTISSSS